MYISVGARWLYTPRHTHTHLHAYTRIHTCTHRQTYRHKDIQTYRHTNSKTYRNRRNFMETERSYWTAAGLDERNGYSKSPRSLSNHHHPTPSLAPVQHCDMYIYGFLSICFHASWQSLQMLGPLPLWLPQEERPRDSMTGAGLKVITYFWPRSVCLCRFSKLRASLGCVLGAGGLPRAHVFDFLLGFVSGGSRKVK